MSQAMDPGIAEVVSIPKEYRGKVLEGWAHAFGNCLTIFQALLVVASVIVPGIAMAIVAAAQHPNDPNKQLMMSGPAFLVGILIAAYLAFWAPRFANIYMRSRLLSAIRDRPGAMFDLSDPEVIMMEIVQRVNFSNYFAAPDDMGFLKLDRATKMLLLDMDKRRYRIPLPAIASLEVEWTKPNHNSNRSSAVAMLLLQVRVTDGMGNREMPVFPLCYADGRKMGGNSYERATKLQQFIYALHEDRY